jgi:hypothetical protein
MRDDSASPVADKLWKPPKRQSRLGGHPNPINERRVVARRGLERKRGIAKFLFCFGFWIPSIAVTIFPPVHESPRMSMNVYAARGEGAVRRLGAP